MDEHTQALRHIQMKTIKQRMEAKQFRVSLVKSKQDVLALVASLLKANMTVSVGGSMTLFESGIIEMLESNCEIRYLDRYHCENTDELFHQALSCDLYITSTNAITMNGELYNVDGNGNRVAALIYGPKEVLVIAGVNKIVNDLQEAQNRVKLVAAPANCVRLNKDNPCTKVGKCMDCNLPTRICSTAVTIERSHVPNRIHVILVNEELGY